MMSISLLIGDAYLQNIRSAKNYIPSMTSVTMSACVVCTATRRTRATVRQGATRCDRFLVCYLYSGNRKCGTRAKSIDNNRNVFDVNGLEV